jgi:hypothetical protein
MSGLNGYFNRQFKSRETSKKKESSETYELFTETYGQRKRKEGRKIISIA